MYLIAIHSFYCYMSFLCFPKCFIWGEIYYRVIGKCNHDGVSQRCVPSVQNVQDKMAVISWAASIWVHSPLSHFIYILSTSKSSFPAWQSQSNWASHVATALPPSKYDAKSFWIYLKCVCNPSVRTCLGYFTFAVIKYPDKKQLKAKKGVLITREDYIHHGEKIGQCQHKAWWQRQRAAKTHCIHIQEAGGKCEVELGYWSGNFRVLWRVSCVGWCFPGANIWRSVFLKWTQVKD